MFWGAAFPAAAFFILALFIPESPRWLLMQEKTQRASAVLEKIGGKDYAAAEEASMNQTAESGEKSAGLSTVFGNKYKRILLLGIIVAMFQQWCGTNVIFNYAQEVFQSAGYDVDNTFINIVVTGIANLIFTFVAIYTVDRLGRRALMLLGAGGLAGIYLILGTCYYFEVSGIF